MDYFFPQGWVPLTPPLPRPALTAAEKNTGRTALVAAQTAKNNASNAAGRPRLPLTWEEALSVLKVALPGKTNDELDEAMHWAQTLWHPNGTSLYETSSPIAIPVVEEP